MLSGDRHVDDRIVSLSDPDARPIKKGRLKAPAEFGYKVLIQRAENHIVTEYEVFKGNPSDKSLLVPAVEKHKIAFGRMPDRLAAWLQRAKEREVAARAGSKTGSHTQARQDQRGAQSGSKRALVQESAKMESLNRGHDQPAEEKAQTE